MQIRKNIKILGIIKSWRIPGSGIQTSRKGRKEIWLQATYSPILDLNNRPYKIIKFATVITEQKY